MHLPTFRSHVSTVLQMHVSQETLRYAPSHLSLSSVHCPPNACLSRDSPTMHLPTFRSHLSTVLQMHFSQEALRYAPSYLSFSFVHCPPNAFFSRGFTLCTFPPFALICPLSSKCTSLNGLSQYAPSQLHSF